MSPAGHRRAGPATDRAAPAAPPEVRPRLAAGGLVVDLGSPHRCLSSALLGGGLGWLRTWLNLQVGPDYARTDPAAHLAAAAAAAGLAGPVVGMMTAVPVHRHQVGRGGGASAVATVGVGHALAAAGTRPRAAPAAGTINLLVVVGEPLSDAGLAGAVQTAVEAKAQALAAVRVPAANADGFATGTATDAICVACPPGARVPFAGPATRVGGDLARAVYQAVLAGALASRRPARTAPGAGRADRRRADG
ncbi:MAG TPA: adenosylcobinamide amidohydrolase [Actinomycetota bacterium]|nr:adenosylcobinamide amidohydrolase [Actinomycetota bacterium]